jgi:hypothetical protein
MRQGSEYMEAVVDLRNKPDLKKSIKRIRDFRRIEVNDESINIFLKFFDDLDELIVEATEDK